MGITNIRTMPVESNTHRFEEITYTVDELNVKALQMIPTYHNVKRIVVYLRGGKGQVGRVRASRLMQFSDPYTLVIGPIIEEVMVVKEKMNFVMLIYMM